MAVDSDNISAKTRLPKGDATPPNNSDDISEMTGSTRESKAKSYADKAVKVNFESSSKSSNGISCY